MATLDRVERTIDDGIQRLGNMIYDRFDGVDDRLSNIEMAVQSMDRSLGVMSQALTEISDTLKRIEKNTAS
ncbi:MAG: hypothetical protein F4118_00895 [Acidimicrobiaceae bacterium]|nr:hypothetical protein [Acidimicrobiaceae bacterium]MYI34975.1 hypothetical protein [Acidimicrobiaceae bacterium]